MKTKRISVRRRGVYVLPNLLTTLGMLVGFYSIIASVDHHYVNAAMAIFAALCFDGVDGRIARAMNAQSAFGAQYDSLADMLSFGAAPAILLFNWVVHEISLHGWHKFSWLSAFVYLACVALRLARFNSVDIPEHGIAKRYFFGLPCPAAAAMIASIVWLGECYQIHGPVSAVIILVVTLFMSLLMVTNIYFRSFKDLAVNEQTRFMMTVLAMLILVAIIFRPAHVIFIIMAVYILSGPCGAVYRWRRRQKALHCE
jgi:CDP-diacylglycerol--serine O-phosphatidyltransferase